MHINIQQTDPIQTFPLLGEIPDPPKKLYFAGDVSIDNNAKLLTVVGSRAYTQYGKQSLEKLIGGLRGFPVIIVSGLALGIDALAHKEAMNAELKTIAVPGSGIDFNVLHPKSNHSIAKSILDKGGALISEYKPKQKAELWTFPQRNRIMAGMSHATLLIEAASKSGTLITARLSTEYNRELLAVPGSIFNENSRGTNQFLKLGATPVTSSSDILRALGISEENIVEKNNLELFKDLSDTEKQILKIVANPTTRDEVIRALKIPTQSASVLLSKMEIDGLIKEDMGVIRKTT